VVLPPPPFLHQILIRSLLVWAGLRAFGYLRARVIVPTIAAVMLTIVLVALLTALDGRRRNEPLFLANLGVTPWCLIILGGVVPLVAELLVRLVA
jgi:hypothetical protein